jgi:hypothetical protein
MSDMMRFRRRATRCLLRGAIAGLRKIHIFRRERQRLPVEPAFEQQRTPGVERAGEIFFELLFQPRELFVGEMRAVGPRIDQRAGGPRGVVEQRLVPEACSVMRVERQLRGGERREAVIIVAASPLLKTGGGYRLGEKPLMATFSASSGRISS